MFNLEENKQKLTSLIQSYVTLYDEMYEDGIIDLEEAERGRDFMATFRPQLQRLKKEYNLAMKEERAKWREELLLVKQRHSGRYQTQKVEEINLRQHYAIRPYQLAIALIDKTLLGTTDTKQIFQDALDLMRSESATGIALNEQAQMEMKVEEAELGSVEFIEIVTKWRGLLGEVERRLQREEQPEHVAHLRGLRKALELAINDISQVLDAELG